VVVEVPSSSTYVDVDMVVDVASDVDGDLDLDAAL
jgi:hypothetical protein